MLTARGKLIIRSSLKSFFNKLVRATLGLLWRLGLYKDSLSCKVTYRCLGMSRMDLATDAIVNVTDVRKLQKKDHVFTEIAAQYGNPPNWSRDHGFVSLCRIILEQQISLSAANAHYLKLKSYLKGLTPQKILRLSDEEMKQCQVSRQKAIYLRELALAVIEKRIIFKNLKHQDVARTREQLTSIKGIGEWTTDIYLMFCLQSKDVFPIGDVAVIKTVKELYFVETIDEIKILAETWRPYKSLATYYFWHYYLSKRNRYQNAIA